MDTSTQVSSVAVLAGGKLAAEITMQARLTHSETLLPHIEQALQMAGVKKGEIAGLAVGLGPGSFTGLRIGLATAKAMSYALKVPLVGIPSLEALAVHYLMPQVAIFALADAQKKNVYLARYAWQAGEAGLSLLTEEAVRVVPLADALARAGEVASEGRSVVLLGDIVQKKFGAHRPPLRGGAGGESITLPAGVLIPPPQLLLPRAAHVAWLGERRLSRGEADDAMTLAPLYLRRSEAEVLWEQRHAEVGK